MTLAITCPTCRQPIHVHASLAGQVFACPHCQQPFTMPAFAPPLPAEPNPLANLDDDQPTSRRSWRRERGGVPIVAVIVAFALVLLTMCALAVGGWYWLRTRLDKQDRELKQIQIDPVKRRLEIEYSRYVDDVLKAGAELEKAEKKGNEEDIRQKRSTAYGLADDMQQKINKFTERYGVRPDYILPKDR